MLNEKLNPKLVIATIAVACALAVTLWYIFVPRDPKKVEPIAPSPPKVDSAVLKPVKSLPPPAPVRVVDSTLAQASAETVKTPAAPRPKDPTPSKSEAAVQRIESKLRLKKPQGPAQVGEYLPLVYWAAREFGRMGARDKALEWVEEGLSFTHDASFFAFGALMDLRQGRTTRARSKAEEAISCPAILDPRALLLAQAVLTLSVNPTDSAARSLASSYE